MSKEYKRVSVSLDVTADNEQAWYELYLEKQELDRLVHPDGTFVLMPYRTKKGELLDRQIYIAVAHVTDIIVWKSEEEQPVKEDAS